MKLKQFEDFKLYVRDEKDWGFWQNDTFEPEETQLIKSIVKSNDVCLDIGANIGYFTILMAKQCELVYAFEPEPTNFMMLLKNIELNDLRKKVCSFDCAVTDESDYEESTQNLYVCSKNNGMHRTYPSVHCVSEPIQVDSIRIDDMKFEVMKINFIKMDAEGSELPALKGMTELLERDRPVILMEFHPPSIEEKRDNPKEIYDLLKGLGYKIYLIPNIKEEFSYEDLYLQTDDQSGGRNILCVVP